MITMWKRGLQNVHFSRYSKINNQLLNVMKSEIKIKNDVDVTIIDIEGTIGLAEAWQFENPESRVATYEQFKESVSRIADIENAHIRVNIRSTGGDVNDALLIYEALRATGATVTTCCYGYVASAATIVAQAASPGLRLIAPTSLYLIHNSLCAAEGNADELEAEVEMLRQTDRRLAEIYASRSGRSIEDIATLMSDNGGRGRWLSPEEAIAEGLVDATITPTVASDTESSFAERAKSGVKALLKAMGLNAAGDALGDDINVVARSKEDVALRLPTDTVATTSITLDEGQRQAQPTAVKEEDDPKLGGEVADSRTRAYESDARNMRVR